MHDGSGPGSGWLLNKVVVKDSQDSCFHYLFECGKWLDEGDGDKNIEVTLPLTNIVQVSAPTEEEEPKQYKGLALQNVVLVCLLVFVMRCMASEG